MSHRSTVVSLALLGSLVLAPSSMAQERKGRAPVARADETPATTPVVFEGIVLDADGAPAVGVVVSSSAGGRAVTDLGGRYRLEAEVPLEAESVEITATAGDIGSDGVVQKSIRLSPARGVTPVEPLVILESHYPPRWLPTFGHTPELSARVQALTVFDDGNGPGLYAAGIFANANGRPASRIARWDGSRWSALGSGLTNALLGVQALAVFDDGSGSALYAGGDFTNAGGSAANRIARWDGTSWSPVGGGMNGQVNSLTVFDDGSGPALYAGGTFTQAGGVAASRIARWDGSSWQPLGGGTNGNVACLLGFDDGSGPALYAGGSFTSAGGMAAKRIAKWDGSSWSALGSGLENGSQTITTSALAVFDDGSGPALYAGGSFLTAGGTSARRIAKWDGSSWTALGSGMPTSTDAVSALAVFDGGSGPSLYAGGSFLNCCYAADYVARWDGASWSVVGTELNDSVRALVVYDDGDGPALIAGGDFSDFGSDCPANYIARWNGTGWSALNNALHAFLAPPEPFVSPFPNIALAAYDDGNGPALYVGGGFRAAGPVTAENIAKWDGSSWSAVGGGIGPDSLHGVNVLTTFDGGDGLALYAGGDFTSAGGLAASNLAKWDGATWSALGAGTSNTVNAVTGFDDGNGPALYVGGTFTSAGGVPANYIARWDGASWSALGTGFNRLINALAVYDDGGGPALYAGGNFTIAGGVPANYIAKWDGASWSPLADGMHDFVNALAVFDDGSGAVLVSGSSGAPQYIAKWNGTSWSPMGGGMDSPVFSLTVFDDGRGPAVYAGGFFTTAGGVAANRIARWDGSSWSALGGGTNGQVLALAVFDAGNGADLYAGGRFVDALDTGDSFLARWGCPTVSPKHDKVRRR